MGYVDPRTRAYSDYARPSIRALPVSRLRLNREQETRDADLTFYCDHVVSELRIFYPDEYELFELLAAGDVSDLVDLQKTAPVCSKHLTDYGLVRRTQSGSPEIAIPVVGRYVGVEFARREGRQRINKVVESAERSTWLERRTQLVASDFRLLEKLLQRNGTIPLFGSNSFPNADEFA